MAIDFPNSPSNNDQFTVGSTTWMYNGTSWVVSLGDASIATGAITADKLASDAVTTAKILDANVTAAKLASGAAVTNIGYTPANLASPTFTGTPTLPTGTIATTQTSGNNTTAVATTAFVTTAVSGAAIAILDNVGDVTITSASSGQVLQWNGSAWINATVSSDVMTDTRNAALLVMDIGA